MISSVGCAWAQIWEIIARHRREGGAIFVAEVPECGGEGVVPL